MVKGSDVIIGLAAVGGAAGLGYIVITRLLPSASSAQCTTPGSPCYSAISPYLKEYQTCANSYAADLQLYQQEDNANGTGLTSSQITTLNYLTGCMNAAAKKIAQAANQYNVDPGLLLQQIVSEAIVPGALLYVGIKTIPGAVNKLRFGGSASAKITNAVTEDNIANGDITPASASAMSDSISSNEQTLIQSDQATVTDLENLSVFTTAEADTLISDTVDSIDTDITVTVDDLLGVL